MRFDIYSIKMDKMLSTKTFLFDLSMDRNKISQVIGKVVTCVEIDGKCVYSATDELEVEAEKPIGG